MTSRWRCVTLRHIAKLISILIKIYFCFVTFANGLLLNALPLLHKDFQIITDPGKATVSFPVVSPNVLDYRSSQIDQLRTEILLYF